MHVNKCTGQWLEYNDHNTNTAMKLVTCGKEKIWSMWGEENEVIALIYCTEMSSSPDQKVPNGEKLIQPLCQCFNESKHDYKSESTVHNHNWNQMPNHLLCCISDFFSTGKQTFSRRFCQTILYADLHETFYTFCALQNNLWNITKFDWASQISQLINTNTKICSPRPSWP